MHASLAMESTFPPENCVLLEPYAAEVAQLRGLIHLCRHSCPSLEVGGVILYGPPGVGKSVLLSFVATQEGVSVVLVSPHNVVRGQGAGSPDRVVSGWFQRAMEQRPSILCIDHIEAVFPRAENIDESTLRLCHAFVAEMELVGGSSFGQRADLSEGVLVVGITHHISNVHPIVLSVLDDRILIDIPTPDQRWSLAKQMVESCVWLDSPPSDEELRGLMNQCHGFTVADLRALVEAAMAQAEERGRALTLLELTAATDSVRCAVKASAKLGLGVPQVQWSDIGGLEDVKARLYELVVWQQEHSAVCQKMGIQPLSGILLYGPPGTGKTMLALAAASESNCHFIGFKIPDLVKGEVGASEQAVVDVFRRARTYRPCIVFVDELQALFGSREDTEASAIGASRMVTQLMLEMDKCASEVEDTALRGPVVVIGATNLPWAVDAALLRPGRLDRVLFVPPPGLEDREKVVDVLRQGIRLSDGVSSRWMAEQTSRWTGADLRNLLRMAGLAALRRDPECLEIIQGDVEEALELVLPSVLTDAMARYETWTPQANLMKQ